MNRNITLQGNPLPQEMLEVLNKGGIPSLLKEMFGGIEKSLGARSNFPFPVQPSHSSFPTPLTPEQNKSYSQLKEIRIWALTIDHFPIPTLPRPGRALGIGEPSRLF